MKAHWDTVWARRRPDEVSWYQRDPTVSLELIRRVTDPTASVVDVGGGASRLVDGLLGAGYSDLTVIDVAGAAIDAARARLADAAESVTWLVGDIRDFEPTRTYDLWHDRAVLHFFVEEHGRDRYVAALRRSLAPGGHAVVAAFGPDGPQECSGLPVRRYDRTTFEETLGEEFEPVHFEAESHHTPAGATQSFLYGVFRRRDPGNPELHR